ncbi:MAG: hypothetical protein JXK05_06305 [Campylobacterales bacterium]|nr:hypothetical protein [Campylobacterales bacterium]
MKGTRRWILAVLVGLMGHVLSAEEVDKAAQCDAAYAACLKQCDTSENVNETCYETCDKTYEACLQSAQQLPES